MCDRVWCQGHGPMLDLEIREGPPVREHWAHGLTIPQLFFRVATERRDDIAARCKHRGIWREITWRAYADRVRHAAMGLHDLGVVKGDRVAILGDPCLEWLVAELGAQSLGATSFGIYPTSPTAEVQHVLADSRAVVAFAEDQEDLDKILEAAPALPHLRAVILIDPTGVFDRDPAFVRSMAELEQSGKPQLAEQAGVLEDLISRTSEDEIALLIYTSGTTALPKGAMVSHRAVVRSWSNVLQVLPPLTARDRVVSYLPLAHIAERTFSLFLPLLTGIVVHFGEGPDAVSESLSDVRPTVYTAPPRVWEKMAAQVLVDVTSSAWVKRRSFAAAMAVGRRYREVSSSEQRFRARQFVVRLAYRIARAFVFRPVLDKFGLDRVTLAITGTAPVPPEIVRLWQLWGVMVRESYGQTETQMATLQYDARPQPGNAGLPLPGVRVATTPSGEIYIDSPGNFDGYWGLPEATAEAVDREWVRTGDLGTWLSTGHLQIVGREKDIIITSGGKNISPAAVENALKTSPYISEAVVIGDGRRYLTALIELDEASAAEWARRNDVLYTSFRSLVEHPRIIALLEAEVESANQQLARVEQVKAFRVLPKQLDVDDGETTATRKIKRQVIIDAFRGLVDEMYDDSAGAAIAEAASVRILERK